jgi:hypothetical protein
VARNTWVSLFNDDPRGLSADGLTLASFTTSAPVFPTIVFPANYFKTGKLLHMRARGLYGSTATPTMTWRLQNTVGTTVTVATSNAITLASSVTNQAWEFDMQIQCRSEGTSGTLFAFGDLNLGLTATTSTTYYIPASGTAPATATVDTTIAQTWGLEVACSASAAQNTVKGLILELKSVN